MIFRPVEIIMLAMQMQPYDVICPGQYVKHVGSLRIMCKHEPAGLYYHKYNRSFEAKVGRTTDGKTFDWYFTFTMSGKARSTLPKLIMRDKYQHDGTPRILEWVGDQQEIDRDIVYLKLCEHLWYIPEFKAIYK